MHQNPQLCLRAVTVPVGGKLHNLGRVAGADTPLSKLYNDIMIRTMELSHRDHKNCEWFVSVLSYMLYCG